jgi:hypothetical protein
MQLQINESRQFGDNRIRILSSILNVFLTLLLMTFMVLIICSTIFFFGEIDGAVLIMLMNFILIVATVFAIHYLKRTYFKIVFADQHLLLCSRLKLLNRKIKYHDIIKIIIDEKTVRRRVETNNEYFEVDNADSESLTLISQEKHINLKRINAL